MKIKEIKEKIERNEDAIDNLKSRVDMDFWTQQRKVNYHNSRIITLMNRLEEFEK